MIVNRLERWRPSPPRRASSGAPREVRLTLQDNDLAAASMQLRSATLRLGAASGVLGRDRESRQIDRAAVVEHFAARCRAVVQIPQDPHLSTGGLITLDQLQEPTRDAALALGAHVAGAFVGQHQTAGR